MTKLDGMSYKHKYRGYQVSSIKIDSSTSLVACCATLQCRITAIIHWETFYKMSEIAELMTAFQSMKKELTAEIQQVKSEVSSVVEKALKPLDDRLKSCENVCQVLKPVWKH